MNLFVISTPSQAFFLSRTTSIDFSNSILLITRNKKGYENKIKSNLLNIPWIKILVWDTAEIEKTTSYYKIFLFRLKLLFLQRRFKSINKVFLGSYNNIFHLGIAAVFENKAQLYLLYDGLQMVSVAQNRTENIGKSIRTYSKLFLLAGFKRPCLHSITYTSPLEFSIPPFDKVIKIQALSKENGQLDEQTMYFAGQPLVDMGLVSLEIYLKKLNWLKTKFADLQIIYIPHPKESREVKEQIIKIFEIQYFDKIFEQQFLESIFFAKNIASFYSSVLINLLFLGAGSLQLYALDIKDREILKYNNRKAILNIYKYFDMNKSSEFKILRF